MPRFTIGEFVEMNGVLAEIYGGEVGTVVSFAPEKEGITPLDEYLISFESSGQLWLCDFQLSHVGDPSEQECETAQNLVPFPK